MNHIPLARMRLQKRVVRERRASVRSRNLLEGTLKWAGQFVQVDITDLSESGAMVRCPVLPDFSDCATLSIRLPDGGPVMVTGRVRRFALGSRDSYGGFAIEFTRFYTQAGREMLREHLAA